MVAASPGTEITRPDSESEPQEPTAARVDTNKEIATITENGPRGRDSIPED